MRPSPATEEPDEARGRMLAVFLQDDYNRATVPLLERYFSLRVGLGGGVATDPSHKIFAVISDELRNVMDHLGRGAVAELVGEVRDELEMASWHLELAHIKMLVDLCEDISSYVSECLYRGDLSYPEIFFEDLADIHDGHEAALHAVAALMALLSALERERRAPNMGEIERTRVIAISLRRALRSYAVFLRRMGEEDGLPDAGV